MENGPPEGRRNCKNGDQLTHGQSAHALFPVFERAADLIIRLDRAIQDNSIGIRGADGAMGKDKSKFAVNFVPARPINNREAASDGTPLQIFGEAVDLTAAYRQALIGEPGGDGPSLPGQSRVGDQFLMLSSIGIDPPQVPAPPLA